MNNIALLAYLYRSTILFFAIVEQLVFAEEASVSNSPTFPYPWQHHVSR